MSHHIPENWLRKPVDVLMIGAGGSGSRMLEQLVALHRTILALGHPYGLQVTLLDDDVVSPTNVGRQAFYSSDIGAYKALILMNRAKMALGSLGASWKASVSRFSDETHWRGTCPDLVIGAVDNRKTRSAIVNVFDNQHKIVYWLDMGNRQFDGQVILGQLGRNAVLPHAGLFFPELLDETLDDDDDMPSCSLAEAIQKQSLFINVAVATFGSNILFQLFSKGEIHYHGGFINLETGTTLPLNIDDETWARFGIEMSTTF